MKKNITYFILIILLSTSSFAQVPELISFQAIIRDADSRLISNQEIGIRILILKDYSTGESVYVETHQPQTNENGLISLKIGSGAVEMGDFSTIDWSETDYYIKTETDITGGSNYNIIGVSQLLSVPFALLAKTVESEKLTTLINNNGVLEYTDEEDNTATINIISSDAGNLISVGSDGGALLSTGGESPWRNEDGTPATPASTNINYPNGNIGIGNDNPIEKLEVEGNIKISGSLQLGTVSGISIGSPCTSEEAGRIIFNGTNFCACNGSIWKRVD